MNGNNRRNKSKCIKELVKIPGVGKVIANGLWNIGITLRRFKLPSLEIRTRCSFAKLIPSL